MCSICDEGVNDSFVYIRVTLHLSIKHIILGGAVLLYTIGYSLNNV